MFTSSVLQNIHQASIYRLIFIVWIIDLVIVDAIMLPIKSLYNINDRPFKIKNGLLYFTAVFPCAVRGYKRKRCSPGR